jgi:hypothetical protein
VQLELLVDGVQIKEQHDTDESPHGALQGKRRFRLFARTQQRRQEGQDSGCQERGNYHRRGPKPPLTLFDAT